MKQHTSKLLSLLFLMMFSLASYGQGYIKMEVTDVGSDDDQMAMMLEMMKGSQTEYFYNDEKSMSKMQMMGGMVSTSFIHEKATDKINMFIDAMGQKMLVESSVKEMEDKAGDQAEDMKDMEVTYDESDVKEVMGYKCYKANVKHPSMEDAMTFSMYISPEIKMDTRMIQGMQYFNLKGFPLEFTMKTPQMTLTSTTVEIKKDLDETVFNIEKSGYKKMTFDELMEMSGGMGGGFGF